MRTYYWIGVNLSGLRVQGMFDAPDIHMVKAWLRLQKITPHKIIKKNSYLMRLKHYRLSQQTIILSLGQLAMLLTAGIPLAQCLELISQSVPSSSLQHCFVKIKTLVESGHSLTSACQHYPQFFTPLFCSFIAIGEHSGRLDDMLKRIALYHEKIFNLKNKLFKNLYYPVLVMLLGMVVTVILMLWIVPQFETLFKNAGVPLPVITRIVIAVSHTLKSYGWTLLLLAGIVFCIFRRHKKLITLTYFIDSILLKIPLAGTLIKQTIIARIARTLSVTLAAGLPILEALNLVASSCGNLLYQNEIVQLRIAIASGQSLYKTLQHTILFPPLIVQMIAIGEEAGMLDQMLSKAADFYETIVDTSVNGLSSLIEPVIMTLLGVVIATLIIAMYLPIFRLGAVL